MSEQQETLAQALDRIGAALTQARTTKLQADRATAVAQSNQRWNSKGPLQTTLANDLTKQMEDWARIRDGLPSFLQFARTCTVKVNKPKVQRLRNSKAFRHKHRYVVPNVFLVAGNLKFQVETLEDVGTVQHFQKWDHTSHKYTQHTSIIVPRLCIKFGVTFYGSDIEPLQRELSEIFTQDAGENWSQAAEKVRAAWQDVESRLDAIVSESFEKKGTKERAIFRDRFITALLQTKGLIDAPPEAIHAIFKLGWSEIEALMKFTRRNQADIDLVDLEDIVTAQNEARVKNVMES